MNFVHRVGKNTVQGSQKGVCACVYGHRSTHVYMCTLFMVFTRAVRNVKKNASLIMQCNYNFVRSYLLPVYEVKWSIFTPCRCMGSGDVVSLIFNLSTSAARWR